MENNLIFNDTFTIEQFKNQMQVSEIHVRRNPKTGSLFFTYGNKVGAVSVKGIPAKPVISHVTGDNGDFFLLHEEAEGAPILATF